MGLLSKLFLIFSCLTSIVQAQDERYYRQILAGELPKSTEESKENSIRKFTINGSLYHVDLNSDGVEELIQPQKRDGVDWIVIMNSSRGVLFEAKLLAMGGESVIYKIKMVNLSPKIKALVLFLDEGATAGKRFESTARIFVISFENNNLNKMSMIQGPHFFHEKQAQREQYWIRDYQVNVHDLDNDGIREIAISYNHINRILKYLGNGEWKRY